MSVVNYHSNWAFAVLLLLLIAIINSIFGVILKRNFSVIDKKIALYSMIGVHIQLIIGIVSYMLSPKIQAFTQNVGASMKDSTMRLLGVEHPIMMLIGISLITIGFMKSKKSETNKAKYMKIVIFYSIGLVLILARIPWSTWAHNN